MGNISENCKCPKLFEELDRQGLSQKEFAAKIGASTGNISDWVSGRSAPTRRRWQTISEVLGKPANELMGTKKEPANSGRFEALSDSFYSLPQKEQEEIVKQMEALIKKAKGE